MDIHTNCRDETGITVGLIDSLISICRILADRDLERAEVREALKDLREDGDFRKVAGVIDITFIEPPPDVIYQPWKPPY